METAESSQSVKRPRPVVSCLQCRQKKLKCDRKLPCSKCIVGGRQEACEYAAGQEPPLAESPVAVSSGVKRAFDDGSGSTSALADITAKYEELQTRVAQLEEAFRAQQRMMVASVPSNAGRVSAETPSCHTEHENGAHYTKRASAQIMSKESLDRFEAARSFIAHLASNDKRLQIADIGRHIHVIDEHLQSSSRLASTFRLHSSNDEIFKHMEELLPPQDACNNLVEHYFNYFENCTRVLHRGTSKAMFRAYFNQSLLPDRRAVCLPMLLAVVSIASSLGTFNDDNPSHLHGQRDGVGVYQLLRAYLDNVSDTAWLELSTLQVAALTLKYHKSTILNDLERWQWSGQVLRRAVAAGLHRSSEYGDNVFESEMKRRLWLTFLETDLTSAVASKMPASCPKWSGDIPLNVDDGQLYPGIQTKPTGAAAETWKDGLCQHLLAQSFNARLSAFSAVTSDTSLSFEAGLQHTRHLEQIIHDLPRLFRFEPNPDETGGTPYRLMAKMEMDFLLRRLLNACYAPFGSQMPADDRYREARIPWIQGCTFSICFQDLFDPRYPTMDLPEPRGLWDYFHNVYAADMEQFLLATCLELQRIWKSSLETTGAPSPAFENQALRTRVRVMGWNADALIKSLEDTIGPLARRVGRHGSCLRDVVRWTIVIGSLRNSPPRSAADSIIAELQNLVAALQRHLQIEDSRLENRGSIIGDDVAWLQSYLLDAST